MKNPNEVTKMGINLFTSSCRKSIFIASTLVLSAFFLTTSGVSADVMIPSPTKNNGITAPITTSNVPRVWLGVQCATITDALAKQLKLDKSDGVLVEKVLPNSPAEKSGVMVGDIVLDANGQKTIKGTDIPRIVRSLSVGDFIKLTILRNNKEIVVNAILEKLDETTSPQLIIANVYEKGIQEINNGEIPTGIDNILKAKMLEEKYYGKKSQKYFEIVSTLFEVYKIANHHKSAEDALSEALSSYEAVYGRNSKEMSAALNTAAFYFYDTGKYDKAEKYFRDIISITRTLNNTNTTAYRSSLHDLALLLKILGRENEVPAVYSSIPEYYNSMVRLKKKMDAANIIEACERVIELFQTGQQTNAYFFVSNKIAEYKITVNNKHPDYPWLLTLMAYQQLKMGEYSKAEDTYKTILDIIRNNSGEDTVDYARALLNYSYLYDLMFWDEKSKRDKKQLLNSVEAILVKMNNVNSHEYAYLMERMAESLEIESINAEFKKDELLNSAAEYRNKAKYVKQTILGELNPAFARYLTKWSKNQTSLNPKIDWKGWFNEGMEIQKKVLGDQHPEYAASLINYSKVEDNSDDEKIKSLKYALAYLELWLGKDNTYYINGLANLADIYQISAYSGGQALAAGMSTTDTRVIKMSEPDRGKLQMSQKLYKHAAYVSEAVYGSNSSQYFEILKKMFRDDIDKNIDITTRLLEAYQITLGVKNHKCAQTMEELASLYNIRYKNKIQEQDYRKAEKLQNESLNIYKTLYDLNTYYFSTHLESLAIIYAQHDRDKAIITYKSVLDIQKQAIGESDRRYLYTLMRYSKLFTSDNHPDYKEAIKVYLEIIRIMKNTSTQDVFGTLKTLAWLYEQTSEYNKAEEIQKELMQLTAVPNNMQDKMVNKMDQLRSVDIMIDLGEYEKAEQVLVEMLSNLSDEELKKEAVTYSHAQYLLAYSYYLQNDYDKAEENYKKSLDTLKRTFNLIDVDNMEHFGSTRYFGLAETFHARGDYKQAETHYKHVLEIEKTDLNSNSIGPTAAEHLIGMGSLYSSVGSFQQADLYFKKGLPVYEAVYGYSHPSSSDATIKYAKHYGLWQKPKLSFEYFERGLKTLDSFVANMSLWASESKLQAYLNKVDRNYDLFYSLVAQYFIGGSDSSKEVLRPHLNYKGRTAEILTTRNRLTLLSNNEKLTKTVDSIKSITQKISMLALSSGSDNTAPEKNREKMNDLIKQKEQLEEKLAIGSSEYADKKATAIMTPDGIAASLPSGGVYLDFVEYRKFDYQTRKWTDERRYLTFMLTRDKAGKPVVRIEDIGPSEAINPLIEKFRAELQKEGSRIRGIAGKRPADKSTTPEASSGILAETGNALYEKLLNPFSKELSTASALIISPSGNLNLIPFEVLTERAKLGYLNDRLTISYSLGRDIVAAKHRRQITGAQANTRLAVVAAPDFTLGTSQQKIELATAKTSSESKDATVLSRGAIRGWPITFQELPGTLREANAIQKIANDDTMQMFIKDRALEENVKKLQHPHVLHIATHGFFLEDVERLPENTTSRGIGGIRPTETAIHAQQETKLSKSIELRNPLLRSGLALAGANRLADNISLPEGADDGILTAAEVTSMNLYGTDLVVLSACETGLGDVHRGEGVSGLRRAFRIAGARNIIMSLWSVPDEETSWLMEEFYRNYFKDGNAVVSLNKARTVLRKKLVARDGTDHPYFWAAFIVEGATP